MGVKRLIKNYPENEWTIWSSYTPEMQRDAEETLTINIVKLGLKYNIPIETVAKGEGLLYSIPLSTVKKIYEEGVDAYLESA